MEIIDKRTKKEEHWQLGDVLVANSDDSKGLIVKNSNAKYCLMNITPDKRWNYSTAEDDCFGNCYKTLSDFYEATYPDWHKVNAKLVIE
ncbi:hypothetical protein [Lactobacillus johnsonii]|uniref:Uncharacterized protein n=1 Tax=Lactobacillus johnsonii TaxID=33959 RepID=A0A9X0SCJ3_LACJH|nr:hypothetical protein [Lactobacillus johnsonii]KXN76901.1 hypothetical protein AYJ53_07495 [Lactobacillus johnsonii]